MGGTECSRDSLPGAVGDHDIRFTTKGDALYAIALAWPDSGELTVQSLSANLRLYPREIAKVQLLGAGDLKWSRGKTGLKVKLPEKQPCDAALALKILPKR